MRESVWLLQIVMSLISYNILCINAILFFAVFLLLPNVLLLPPPGDGGWGVGRGR